MVRVVEVDLRLLGVRFPSNGVGMVVAQPFVELTHHEPFIWEPAQRGRAFACIDATLEVARARAHGADKTHFTVFPELTVPGVEGVIHITSAMLQADWSAETVIIGGVEGLTSEQYAELLALPNTYHDEAVNSPDTVSVGQWVNCCITWVKLPNNEVRLFVQPKLAPAWVELDLNYQSMYRGRSIFVFKGLFADSPMPYRFSTLVCFDWIGSAGNHRIWEWLLKGIQDVAAAAQATLPLTWMFVAQYNPEPSHFSFMTQVDKFYDSTIFQNVCRDDTCLVMANVAGRSKPGNTEKYGRTAVITTGHKFSKPGCVPTYGNGGGACRAGNPLQAYRDAVFRESGACIHSFFAVNPRSLPPGGAGRAVAITAATVHPYLGMVDPRVPAGQVPAIVKWVNDILDETTKSLAARHPFAALSTLSGTAHGQVVSSLRPMDAPALDDIVLVASASTSHLKVLSLDTWSDKESAAIEHVLNIFSMLKIAQYAFQFHGQGSQATVSKNDHSFEVVAVSGDMHEACYEHVTQKAVSRRAPLVVVSRDADNTAWNPRLGNFLNQGRTLSDEYNITNPASAVIEVGYRAFLDAYLNAQDGQQLEDALHALLN